MSRWDEDEPVACIDCGAIIDADVPERCPLCEAHAEDLTTIPSTPVPYGSGR